MEPISSSTLANVALSALRTGAGQVSRRRAARKVAEAERLAGIVTADTDKRVLPILAEIKSIASEPEQTRIGALLRKAEFHEHSRAVSIAVLTKELERTREDLTRNLSALLVLIAGIEPGRSQVYAGSLNRVLIAQNEVAIERIRQLDRKQAERVVDRASMERTAGYLRSLSARASLLDRMSPTAVKAALDFSVKYRSILHARTASITPAHFDTQRRVPINELYVTPSLRPDGPDERPSKLSLPQVVRSAYRTVVLGPPGAGKSTLAQKIAYELSDDQWEPDASPIPFIVTLRKYEERKIDRHYSVVDYIEAHVREEYQLPAPPGAVEFLLATGRGFVIFDGMDELLQTHRRREMGIAIESFAHLYGSTSVLVTSREVGYRDAPLSEVFSVVTLLEFSEESVVEYVRKWFGLDESLSDSSREVVIDAFLRESESVPDLRSNALMLSLLCNVYRGAGFIPENRADLYEQCATMLFERWDSSRGISTVGPLKSDARAALHDVALWAFTDPTIIDKIPEKRLTHRLTIFWLRKRYESREQAKDAAVELLVLWRGRAWVLTDVGTTPRGERLYKFTHQTFLEYFAGVELVRVHPAPSRLWKAIFEPLRSGGWDIVAQIAIQIIEEYSAGACDRVYELLLKSARVGPTRERLNLVSFAARHLESLMPSPAICRLVTRSAVDMALESQPSLAGPAAYQSYEELASLSAGEEETDEEEAGPRVTETAEVSAEEALAPLLTLLAAGEINRSYVIDELQAYLTSLILEAPSIRAAQAFVFAANLHVLESLVLGFYGLGIDRNLMTTCSAKVLAAVARADVVPQRVEEWAKENFWAPVVAGRVGMVTISRVVELTCPETLLWAEVPVLHNRLGDMRVVPFVEPLLRGYLRRDVEDAGEFADSERTLEMAGREFARRGGVEGFSSSWMAFTSLYNEIAMPYFPHQRSAAEALETEEQIRRRAHTPLFPNPYAAYAAALLLAVVVEYEEWHLVDQSEDQVALLRLGPIQALDGLFICRRVPGFAGDAAEILRASNLPESGCSILQRWAFRTLSLVR